MTTKPYQGHRKHAIERIEAHGIMRARDFKTAGIPLVYLKRLVDSGELTRLNVGLYQQPERMGEDVAHNLAEASRLVPHGVISLLSALCYHNLTTQLPNAVWMTIPNNWRTPTVRYMRLETVRATGQTLKSGLEYVCIEGVQVPIYGVAKTVADCFKHRRRVGEDVAVEALKDAVRQRKTTPGELMHYANINRTTRRIEPYLRAMQ